MSTSKSTRRTVLTDDGELHEINDEPSTQPEPAYCTKCGTANPPDSNFCRKCGNSLVEQDAAMMGVPNRDADAKAKGKHEFPLARFELGQGRQAALSTPSMIPIELITLIGVGLMTISSFIFHYADASIFILLAWFLVEASRRALRRTANPGAVAVEAVTMAFVTGLVISSFAFHQADASIFILLAWFLIEATRYALPSRH